MQTFWRNLLSPSSKSRTCRYTIIPWTWRLNITVKCWSISTELQDITSDKTVIFIVLTMRTSNYNTWWCLVPNRICTDLCVKAQNFMRDWWGSSRLHFMEVPKHVQSSTASSIVQLALCQHPKQCRFASICTSHNGHTYLYVMLIIWDLYNKCTATLLKHCLWTQKIRRNQQRCC
jgi:hypothetical protein